MVTGACITLCYPLSTLCLSHSRAVLLFAKAYFLSDVDTQYAGDSPPATWTEGTVLSRPFSSVDDYVP